MNIVWVAGPSIASMPDTPEAPRTLTRRSDLRAVGTTGSPCTPRWVIDRRKISNVRSNPQPNPEAQRWRLLGTKTAAKRFLQRRCFDRVPLLVCGPILVRKQHSAPPGPIASLEAPCIFSGVEPHISQNRQANE